MNLFEKEIFDSVLEQASIIYECDNGLYTLHEEELAELVQTNGYNLLESLRRLINSEIVQRRLK